jgi:hypothetical protein
MATFYYIFERNFCNQASYVLLHGKEDEINLLKLRALGRVEMGCLETPHLL